MTRPEQGFIEPAPRRERFIDAQYGWACTDPDCDVSDPGPYTEEEADARRQRHETEHER